MKIFITGAGGFIGQATITELVNHGHTVLGMARSPSSQETVKSLGAEPFNATLEDTEALKSAASQCDGVIHLAFVHDFEDFEKSTRIDQAAIGALAEGLAAGPGGAKGKPLVIASGTMMLPKGEPATEDAKAEEQLPWSLRAKSADLVYDLSRDTGIRGSVMRLPPTVHGAGDKGMIPMIVGALKEKAGYVAIIGDGSVRWPTVHRSDAAVLFRLAVEKGTGGATYHAVAEGAVPMKDIMAVAGKKTGVPVEKKTVEELMSAIGMLGGILAADNPTSSEKTKKELGWTPKDIGLIEDLEKNYFN